MRKIAFSVWPDLPQNPVPEVLNRVRDSTSVPVLKEAGYEVVVRKDLPDDDIIKIMLPHNNSSIRYYTKISDYMRLKFIKEYLDQGYDEVVYFDYDFVIKEAPTGFGCSFEMHLETADGQGEGEVVKFWARGVNSVYNIGKQHYQEFMEHFDNVVNDIKASDGSPKFTYPMNSMWPIEEGIGHIPGYFHFGSLKNPNFCTIENIKQSLILYSVMYQPVNKITGYNAMGTRDLSGLEEEISSIFGVNEFLETIDISDACVKSITARFSNNLRIRPNYNSHASRQIIRNLLSNYKND